AMSGGQRQRVALGRAILRHPKVMLLDEPLSNLDAKLRSQMRSEIAKLHKQLKTTFIYVTHDQVEAMTLGTRVVVMKLGRIQQIGTPKDLYDYPDNKFVAGFLGTPQMNFFEGTLLEKGKEVEVKFKDSKNTINIPNEDLAKLDPVYLDGKHKVYLGIRCENVSVSKDNKTGLDFKISHFEELGNETLIYGDLNLNSDSITESKSSCIVKALNSNGLKEGDVIKINMDVSHIHLFDKETEVTILPRVPKYNSYVSKVSKGELSFEKETIKLPQALNYVKEFSGNLYIPLDAIDISSKGRITGTLKEIEKINDTLLGHLKLTDGRIMFVKLDKEYKVGEKVKFNVLLDKISLMDNGKDIINKIGDYDKFTARFLNYKTVIDRTKDSVFEKDHEKRIQEVNSKYEKLTKEENDKYVINLALAQKTDTSKIKEKNKSEVVKKDAQLKEALKVAKEKYQKNKVSYSNEHKVLLKKANDEIDTIYGARRKEEDSSYKEFLKINRDSDAKSRRRQDHIEFNETFSKEKENDLNLKISAENLRYDTFVNANKAEFKRSKVTLKDENKAFKKACYEAENPVKVVEAKHKKDLANFKKEKAIDEKKAGLIYFFNINGTFIESTDIISNKLNQGLGTKVFTKEFLVEFPHDSYKLGKSGFGIKVEENLDFGDFIAVKCSYVDVLKTKKYVYLKSEKEMKVGETVFISFDIVKSHITEIGMDIKLY
ncbi:MAG: ATP-binding cassette domain-containing protein, partial [Bacilli bacterium]